MPSDKEIEAAREVLEQYVYDEGGCEVERVPAMVREMLEAAARVRAEANAGYRILAPGEVDAETLERAAEVARHVPTPADVQDPMLRLGYISASQAIADAIRTLEAQEGGR